MDNLREELLNIPELTTEARTILLELAVQVDTYGSPHGDRILWIPLYGPWYESRWSVSAWNAYCAGEHLPNQCQCRDCQEARWQKGGAA